MKIFTLLQTQYYKFENAVKSYLARTLSGFDTSYGNNTIFGQLINVLNGVVQNIMLYIEDSMVEQNKYTAQRKKSIYGLASISGYKPHLGKAAGVQLSLTYIPNNLYTLDVIVNNHELITCSRNGMIYNLVLPQEAIILSVNNDNSTKYIYAVQGKFEKQTFISEGGKFYTKNFNFVGNLDVDYLTVKVNNKKWDYQESLYDMIPDGEQWTYDISPVGGIDLIFGNDVHGRALKDGDTIEVTYLIHDGAAGNLDVNNESYFIFNNPLKDINGKEVDGNSIFNLSLASLDSITSGSDSESVEQVRLMIGHNSRSLVLASPDNYGVLLNRFSFCGYNRTWSTPGSMLVSSLIMKNYKALLDESKTYFDLTENDFKLSNNQKKSLMSYIENSGQQLAGVTYQIVDPTLCKYALYVYVKPKSSKYDKDYITNQIRSLVAEFFSEVKSDIFIPKSDIVQLLKNNISEIDSVDLYFLSEKNELAMQVGYYDQTINNIQNEFVQQKSTKRIYLYEGENPNIGLDSHGNIYLQSDEQFPVLMGGWDYLNKEGDEVTITDPLIISYE